MPASALRPVSRIDFARLSSFSPLRASHSGVRGRLPADCSPDLSRSSPVSPMAPECMDGSSTRYNFTTVRYAARDEVFFSGFQGNPVSVEDQRVATLHNDHIFVVIVDMLRRGPCFRTRPERHLASIDPIEHVTLDTWSGLIGSGNPVRGTFHELREVVHAGRYCRTPTADRASSGIVGALGIVCFRSRGI